MSTAPSVGAFTAAMINEQAKAATLKYSVEFGKADISKKLHEVKKPLEVGEVEFTGFGGHRAKYIIVPKEEETADATLRWMFTDKHGWKMKAPNLLLSMYGGRDHYVNWANSDTLKNRAAWGLDDDFKFQARFKSRLEEIAGGVCQAVTECGGWFDFGTGARGGMNEVIKDGLRVYWSAFGSLSGFKPNSVVLGIRKLDETEGEDDFRRCARKVRTNTDGGGEPEPIDVRVIYPGKVDPLIFPEITGAAPIGGSASASGSASGTVNETKELSFAIMRRFLSNALTHIIFVQNNQVHDSIVLKLKSMATRAVIFANGAKKLVLPGVDGKILMEAMTGVPVVVLHNTGGAAECLGAAVAKRRQPTLELPDYDFRLPENVPTDQFLILNPAKDSVEKVINKLTLVLSTVQDGEMMEVGYSKGEQSRILYAWEMYSLFVHNAALFRMRARRYFYVGMLLQFLLTVVSLLWELVRADGDEDIELDKLTAIPWHIVVSRHVTQISLYVFPLLTGFCLSLTSRFNPVGKYTSLMSGAVRIRSEIYQYRCRVGSYMPIKTQRTDIGEIIEELCEEADPFAASDAAELLKKRRQRKENARPKEVSRRSLFSEELERINCDACGADVAGDVLRPPEEPLSHFIATELYNSNHLIRSNQSNSSFSCFASAPKRATVAGGVVAVHNAPAEGAEDETTRLVWNKAGGDFKPNAHMLEDDFLCDDGISVITAEDYMFFRFMPLVHHHTKRSSELTRRVQALQVCQFFLTALLAGSAPLQFERWVPAFVSLITFISGTLEFECYPAQLRNVNQSLECLKNLRIWWQSLSMVERRMPKNKELLVCGAEATADSEISAWKKTIKQKAKGTASDTAIEEEEQKE